MSTETIQEQQADQTITGGESVPLPEAQPTSTEPVLCLVMVGEGDAAKPCQKATGHTGDHSSRKYTKIDTSVVTLDLLSVFDEEEEDPGDIRVTESGYVPTSPQELLVMDNLKASHAKWVSNGKPKNFNSAEAKAARGKYRVEPDNEAAVRKMLKDTATYLGLHVRIAPRVKLANGEFRLYWMATDKPPAPAKKGTTTSTPAAEPAPAEGPTSESASVAGTASTGTGEQAPAESEKPAEPEKPGPAHHVPTPEEMVKAAAERHSRRSTK